MCPHLGEGLEVDGALPSLTPAASHFPAGFIMHILQWELVPVFNMGEFGKRDREDGEDFT